MNHFGGPLKFTVFFVFFTVFFFLLFLWRYCTTIVKWRWNKLETHQSCDNSMDEVDRTLLDLKCFELRRKTKQNVDRFSSTCGVVKSQCRRFTIDRYCNGIIIENLWETAFDLTLVFSFVYSQLEHISLGIHFLRMLSTYTFFLHKIKRNFVLATKIWLVFLTHRLFRPQQSHILSSN